MCQTAVEFVASAGQDQANKEQQSPRRHQAMITADDGLALR
jgi:hypothetical protein